MHGVCNTGTVTCIKSVCHGLYHARLVFKNHNNNYNIMCKSVWMYIHDNHDHYQVRIEVGGWAHPSVGFHGSATAWPQPPLSVFHHHSSNFDQ